MIYNFILKYIRLGQHGPLEIVSTSVSSQHAPGFETSETCNNKEANDISHDYVYYC